MIIKNNTNAIAEISYYDRYGASIKHTLCIRPYGTHEINARDGILLNSIELDKLQAKGILTIEDAGKPVVSFESPSGVVTIHNAGNHEESDEQDLTQGELEDLANEEEQDLSLGDPENLDSDDEQENDIAPGSIVDSFICEVCGKEFASSRGLSIHMKSHES